MTHVRGGCGKEKGIPDSERDPSLSPKPVLRRGPFLSIGTSGGDPDGGPERCPPSGYQLLRVKAREHENPPERGQSEIFRSIFIILK
jgi:hypothetical protein